jgi:hypothetical protein
LPSNDELPGNEAPNLPEFLSTMNELSLSVLDDATDAWILRCTAWTEYLNAPTVQQKKVQGECLPSGSSKGSLCFDLRLESEDYATYTAGKSNKWYRFKKMLIEHISGKERKTN